MKTRLSLLASMLILLATTANAQTSKDSLSWQTYTVNGEKFSVALPTLPAMHLSSELVRPPDKYGLRILMGSYADGVVYTVYVLENVKPLLSLDNFVDQQGRAGNGWNLIGERTVSRDGVSVRAVVYGNPDWGMSQYFAIDDRLYRFEAFGAPANDPRLTKFFESLSFAKPKHAIAVVDGPGKPYEPPDASDATGDVQKVFTGREVDRKARLAMKPEPSYTEDARLNTIAGTVVLKCIFASNGSVMNIVTVSGLPFGLTERAIDAAKKIKFIPAMKNGKYVSMWMQLEYNFNLY